MKKWIVPISLALALAACNDVSTVTPVAQSQTQQVKATAAAGVTVTAGDNGNWGTSFNGLITITNPNATATTWATLKVKLPAGSGITGAPWGASDAVTLDANGYYNFVPNGWSGKDIGANASITISYSGTGSNSKATECYLDGSTVNLCGTTVVADTTAPTASLVASSTSVTAAGSVTFTATAADNVGVTKVEFYEGTTLLASKTAAPFTNSVSYTSANNGTKSYTVKAFDAAGNVTTSSAVSVVVNIATVVNPSVTLAASSTSVTTASTLTLTATPANITPSKVEFYSGTTLIATKTAAPYTHAIALTSANNGAKTFTAKVYSAASTTAAATSAAVNVNVNIATTPAITLAASSTSITTASTLTLTATPSNVTPSKVEFYSGTTLIATKTAAPYVHNLALTSANNGAKTFTAKVYKSGTTAAVATSAAVNVTVAIGTTADTTKPTASLAASSTSVTAAGSVTFTATATDNVGVSKVEFFEGATLLATKTAAPFTNSVSYTSANNGNKSYTVKAYDAAGNVTTSSAVSVVVNIATADTTAPTVSLATSSASVTADGSVTLTATASDNVGVSKVEFYDGTTLLATDITAPYTNSVSYTSANNGSKSYTVKAYDAAGNVATSAAVSVNVNIASSTERPTVTFGQTSSYPGAYNGQILIKNTTSAPITSWVLKFKLAGNATIDGTPWGAAGAISVDSDGFYVITPNAWGSANIAVGATATISYNGKGVEAGASVCFINGIDCFSTAPDTTAPTISLNSSSTSVTSTSNITLSANAADNVGIRRVESYDGSSLVATVSSAPFNAQVGLSSSSNGTHSYTAKAIDYAGNSTVSSAVNVVVNITDTSVVTLTQASVTNWLGGAKGAHTIALDDYCSGNTSGIEQYAIPLLNARGLKASLGVIANNCTTSNWTNLKADVTAGHEPFNHTLSHIGELEAGTLAPIAGWNLVNEVKGAHDVVKSNTGYDMTFIGFPSNLTTDTTRDYVKSLGYLGARAAKAAYDGSPAGYNSASHDLNGVMSYSTDSANPFFVKWDGYDQKCTWSLYEVSGQAGKGVCPTQPNDQLVRHAQKAIDSGIWSYINAHGINDASWQSIPLDQFTTYADFLKAKVDSGELWVATPSSVIRYRGTRANCTVNPFTSTAQGSTISFNTASADCNKYATLLTLDLVTSAKPVVMQGSQLLNVTAAGVANHWYVNANPLNGSLLVK